MTRYVYRVLADFAVYNGRPVSVSYARSKKKQNDHFLTSEPTFHKQGDNYYDYHGDHFDQAPQTTTLLDQNLILFSHSIEDWDIPPRKLDI